MGNSAAVSNLTVMKAEMTPKAFVLGSNGWVAVNTLDPEEATTSILETWKGPLGEACTALLTGGGPVKLAADLMVHMPADQWPKLQIITLGNGDEVLGLQLSPVQSCIFAAADWQRKNNTGSFSYKRGKFLSDLYNHVVQNVGLVWETGFRRFQVEGLYAQLALDPRLKLHQIGFNPSDVKAILGKDWQKHAKWDDDKQCLVIPAEVFRMRYPVGSPTGIHRKDVVVLFDRLPGKLYCNKVDLAIWADGDDDGDGGAGWKQKGGTTCVTFAGPYPRPTMVPCPSNYLQLAYAGWKEKGMGEVGSNEFVSVVKGKVLGMLAKSLVGITTHVLNYCACRALAQKWVRDGVSGPFHKSEYVQMTLAHYRLKWTDLVMPPQSRRMRQIVTRVAYAAVAQFFNPVLESEMDQGKSAAGIAILIPIANALMEGLSQEVAVSDLKTAILPILKPGPQKLFNAFLNQVSEKGIWSVYRITGTLAGSWIASGNSDFKQLKAFKAARPESARQLLDALYGVDDVQVPEWEKDKREHQDRRPKVIEYNPFWKKERVEALKANFVGPPRQIEVVAEPADSAAEVMDGVQYTYKNSAGWHNDPLLEEREANASSVSGYIPNFWTKQKDGRRLLTVWMPTIEKVGKGHILKVGDREVYRPITFRWRPRWETKSGAVIHTEKLHKVSLWEFLEMALMKAIRTVIRKGYADEKNYEHLIQEEFNKVVLTLPSATPGRVAVYSEVVSILQPKDWDEHVTISESWREFEKALTALAAYPQIRHGIGFTNKSHPGTTAAFIDPLWQTPKFVLGYHPLQRFDEPNPKRWAEYLGIDSALRLAHVEDCIRAFEVELGRDASATISKEYLRELHGFLPKELRERTEWVLYIVDPQPYPLEAEGMGRMAYLAGKEVSLNCAFGKFEGITRFDGECIGTIGASPSALMKLALCSTVEQFTTEVKKDQYIENLKAQGVPGSAIHEECHHTPRTFDTAVETWTVTCNWPRLDAGKIKGLAPFKGVISPIPFQGWTETDTIDLWLDTSMLCEEDGKIAFGAAATGGLKKNGIRVVRHDQTPEELIELAKTEPEEIWIENVLATRGYTAKEWERYPHHLLERSENAELLGSTVVLPLPFYRPEQTVASTYSRRHQVKVEVHAAIHAGITPDEESTFMQEKVYLMNQLLECEKSVSQNL